MEKDILLLKNYYIFIKNNNWRIIFNKEEIKEFFKIYNIKMPFIYYKENMPLLIILNRNFCFSLYTTKIIHKMNQNHFSLKDYNYINTEKILLLIEFLTFKIKYKFFQNQNKKFPTIYKILNYCNFLNKSPRRYNSGLILINLYYLMEITMFDAFSFDVIEEDPDINIYLKYIISKHFSRKIDFHELFKCIKETKYILKNEKEILDFELFVRRLRHNKIKDMLILKLYGKKLLNESIIEEK